ncbi:thioredoxin domain-containing protein [Bacteroidota bacterium]
MENTENKLAKSSSPYLRQHASNPVNWYEWGEEALNKAKEENKPLIISIGYAACHWCHVMAHESFEDTAVARIMNENFVCIKIDREERPDIDQIYMDAIHLLNGQGGWPLNAFALADGRPFYAGTYFRKDQWIQVLEQILELYKNEYNRVEQQANQLTEGIKNNQLKEIGKSNENDFSKEFYDNIYAGWKKFIDWEYGGYTGAPKFPLPIGWEFLLQQYYLNDNKEALSAVEICLDEMAKKGIYDQIGGGFARYAVDKYWIVPHFEKMLYDNGQLVSLYSHAFQITQKERYKEIVKQTLEFIERELTNNEGGFYSSLNADSEGEEGKFYVWTEKEIDEVLSPENAELIKDYYQISSNGNWEHSNNILYSNMSKEKFADKNKLDPKHFNTILEEANSQLLYSRNYRIRPSTDDKILTSWNAIMLKGYIDAYNAFGNSDYLEIALKNAKFIEEKMIKTDGSLWRNYIDKGASILAFLDDYALLADAYISLYEASLDTHWLNQSKSLIEYALDNFYEERSGLFYYTSDKGESLVARTFETSDNVIPASNSIMANVLFTLGLYYENDDYIIKSKKMLAQVRDKISSGGPYYSNWAILSGKLAYGINEVVIMGQEAKEYSSIMQKEYLPTSIFMGGVSEKLPLEKGRLQDGKTMIYVCRNKTCKLPVKNTKEALEQISF